VSHLGADPAGGEVYATLRDAVAEWNALPDGLTGVIAIMDSVSEHDRGAGPIEVRIGPGSRLLVIGADWPLEEDRDVPGSRRRAPGRLSPDGVRPHLDADLVVHGTATADSTEPGELLVDGLLVEGVLTVAGGNLGLLALSHTTLVPSYGGIRIDDGNPRLRLTLRRAITGPIVMRDRIRRVELVDSIVNGDAGSPGGAIHADTTEVAIDRSTILGPLRVQALWASDAIFAAPVHAVRRQVGCVRFSYVPPSSHAPRRYRCQPDLELASRLEEARRRDADGTLGAADLEIIRADVETRIVPIFVALDDADPDLARLAPRCCDQIRTGAENGSEMGAFCFLSSPQREENLRRALDEYLRFGFEAGIFFAT
jgi:hypothetical protein